VMLELLCQLGYPDIKKIRESNKGFKILVKRGYPFDLIDATQSSGKNDNGDESLGSPDQVK